MAAVPDSHASYRFGRFELNPSTRQLLAEGEALPLGARAFDVLLALIERRERLVTKDELLELVWPGLVVEENNLQVQISTLRKLLGAQAIATIPGRGYRFTLAFKDTPPQEDELDHRLTAILAADVAGYSRMMETDERATVTALDQVRAVFRKEIDANRGRVVDMAGDSVLALFDAATDAVATALTVQQQMEAAVPAQPAERRMRVRIGVHLGDVFVKPDHTVYGNGVNVAARLQALARPGGICISQTLYDTVKRKLTLQAEFAGPQSFKNIAEPVPAWHILSGSAELPASSAPAELPKTEARLTRWVVTAALTAVVLTAAGGTWWWAKRESASEQARVDPKSIAVLPFANMSPDKDNVHFADGVQEDLLTQLALLGELKVVSRTSASEYRDSKKNLRQIGAELGVASVVEGSVRRSGSRVRVTVQLIDAQSDKHLWGNAYDRELKDILTIQSELATEIAKALKISLSPREEVRLARRPTDNFQAYELFLRHQEIVLRRTYVDVGMKERVELLSRAVELDPKFALAWARLAADHARMHALALDPSDARMREAQDALDRALTLAPDDLEVRAEAGNVYLYGYRDLARAAQHVEELLRAAPNHVAALYQLAVVRRRQGRWVEAIALLDRTVAIDPRNLDALAGLRESYRLFRHFDKALAFQRRLLELQPGNIDARCTYYQIEYFKTGSFAGYDSWRATLPPGSEQSSQRLWVWDLARATSKRDFDAVLRLLDSQPPSLSRFLPPDFMRALALWAKGDTAQAAVLARKDLRRASAELRAAPQDFLALFVVVFNRAILGERKEAVEQFQRWARTDSDARRDAYTADLSINLQSRLYALVGDRERFLKVLRRQVRRNAVFPVYDLPITLYYARFWDDPEFRALIADPVNNAPLPIVDLDPATLVANELDRD